MRYKIEHTEILFLNNVFSHAASITKTKTSGLDPMLLVGSPSSFP